MNTSGAARLLSVILSAVTAFLVTPVCAQLYTASQKNSSLTSIDKEFAINRSLFDETKPVRIENYHTLLTLSMVSLEDDKKSKNLPSTPANHNDFITAENTKSNSEEEVNFRTTSFIYPVNSRSDVGLAEYPTELLLMYAKSLKEYARKNGFDTSYAFLSNMGMLCDKKRFFVVNLTTMKVEQSGLVSHGRGQGATIYDKQYSNGTGSRCTSLGRYKILGRYNGNYGEAYKMAGLDSSNHNAYDRNIVLHSMNCIPDVENRFPACVSDGCPAVSSKFLSSLSRIIDTRKKPVLLWIFDSNLEEPVTETNYIEPISIGLHLARTNSIVPRTTLHTNEQLHAIVSKKSSSYQNKFVQWMSKKGNQISRFGYKMRKKITPLKKK